MFENLGFQEITLIAIVFIVFFGPKKIPEVMHGIGRGVREFRRAMADVKSEISNIAAVPPDNTTIHRAPAAGQTIHKAEPPAPAMRSTEAPNRTAGSGIEAPAPVADAGADAADHGKQSSTGE